MLPARCPLWVAGPCVRPSPRRGGLPPCRVGARVRPCLGPPRCSWSAPGRSLRCLRLSRCVPSPFPVPLPRSVAPCLVCPRPRGFSEARACEGKGRKKRKNGSLRLMGIEAASSANALVSHSRGGREALGERAPALPSFLSVLGGRRCARARERIVAVPPGRTRSPRRRGPLGVPGRERSRSLVLADTADPPSLPGVPGTPWRSGWACRVGGVSHPQ